MTATWLALHGVLSTGSPTIPDASVWALIAAGLVAFGIIHRR